MSHDYAKLEAVVAEMIGYPEKHCQLAMAEIYIRAGWLPRMEIPSGSHDWARAQGRSMIKEWVEASGLFVEVRSPQPGDLLGFRLGRILHHVSIQLDRGRMVHVIGDHGVQIAPFIPTPWLKRIECVWRVK